MKTMPSATSRRQFLSRSVAAAATVMIVPSHVVARGAETPPSGRLNIAGIGVGGMGAGDIGAVAPGNNIVALCDVDSRRSATPDQRPEASRARTLGVVTATGPKVCAWGADFGGGDGQRGQSLRLARGLWGW